MKKYLDKTFFKNPLFDYLKWLVIKIIYQLRYWGRHLRINYKCSVSNSKFGKNNWLGPYSEIANSTIGDFTYCGSYCVIQNADIGKFCSIGPNVKIAPGKHPTTSHISTHPSTFNNQSNFVKNFVTENTYKNFENVSIGNDVWIGANCVILDGVCIGNGAIIAANSVVNKIIEAYDIVGGVPAKFIKKRFTDAEIGTLLTLKWWDKDEQWIQEHISKFWSVGEFMDNLGD
jgi:chloramphenicol O-acetyltransferase type B